MAEASAPTEARSISFLNEAKGKSTRVNIINRIRIGAGEYGNIDQADVMIGTHKKRFVIKEYRGTSYSGIKVPAQEHAAQAMVNYQVAKEAGLKVFPTYRIDEDGNGASILMTSGNTESIICKAANDPSVPGFDNIPGFDNRFIQEIDTNKFEALARDLFSQAIIATEHGITLHSDAFFFLYDEKKPDDLDFVIGDLDNVNKRDVPYDEPRLVYNLESAQSALSSFMTHSMVGAPMDSPNYTNNRNAMMEMYKDIKTAKGFGD